MFSDVSIKGLKHRICPFFLIRTVAILQLVLHLTFEILSISSKLYNPPGGNIYHFSAKSVTSTVNLYYIVVLFTSAHIIALL